MESIQSVCSRNMSYDPKGNTEQGKKTLKCTNHISQKWWLGASQVVCAVGVENFAVVFDAKSEVFDHGFCQITPFIDNQPKRFHVAIPAIHLIEATAGDDEWKAS